MVSRAKLPNDCGRRRKRRKRLRAFDKTEEWPRCVGEFLNRAEYRKREGVAPDEKQQTPQGAALADEDGEVKR